MKLQFLGTGAADWPDPGPQVGNGRRWSSAMLDGRIMLDCGPMTIAAMDEFGVSADEVEHIVISHPHRDHLDIRQVVELARRRSAGLPPLTLHLNWAAFCPICGFEEPERLHILPFHQTDTFDCGATRFQAIPANHCGETNAPIAAHLLITNPEGKSLLYQLDGCWLMTPAWKALQTWHKTTGKSLDAIVWELTCGNQTDWREFEGHANFTMVREMNNVLTQYGVASPQTRLLCSHIARFIDDDHESLQAAIAPDFLLARDGMSVTF